MGKNHRQFRSRKRRLSLGSVDNLCNRMEALAEELVTPAEEEPESPVPRIDSLSLELVGATTAIVGGLGLVVWPL